ncbi:MAG TPA: hypothetical protein PKE04_22325, partial [Clostridia bacterium]|nr:hypothetical protein [Clostridia bacterium]
MHEKGRSLGRAFYEKAVVPLLPKIPHAAAFLGPGSDVLGFDDATSSDHDWGPRCRLFVCTEADCLAFERALKNLPEIFAGHPVWFGRAEDGVSVQGGEGRAHLVRVHTIEGYLNR